MKNKLIKKVIDKSIDKNAVHNIRENSKLVSTYSNSNVNIKQKENSKGIEIYIKENSKNEIVYIPVVISTNNVVETVYNDIYVGENAEATIYAGCVIHNDDESNSTHNGIHTFHLEKNSKITYIENHYAEGFNEEKNINMSSYYFLKENAVLDVKTTQIEGVNNSIRTTEAYLANNAILDISEKIVTTNNDKVKTSFTLHLDGINSHANLSSKSVAKDKSKQEFVSNIHGNNICFGHVSCDAIVMDNSSVSSTPSINANNANSTLSHEAVIGKIATDQIIKLMTFGLSKEEAEREIICGFLN